MAIKEDQAIERLHRQGLRATGPRVAVLRLLGDARTPLSHSEVVEKLGETDCDPATVYRNLIRLTEAGLAEVVSRVDGTARYALVRQGEAHAHPHPHFLCTDCGQLSCLPAELTADVVVRGRWGPSLRQAKVQFQGSCPDCLAKRKDAEWPTRSRSPGRGRTGAHGHPGWPG